MSGILIVDDDPTIRAMFARALGSLGEVEVASNGGEALRMLGAKKYGIVLLDLHMPVIDGYVVLHTLAGKPGPNKETPIYVITADTSEQARIRALRRHALFFLTKPVPIGMLTSLVDASLKKANARAQAREPGSAPPPPATMPPATPRETLSRETPLPRAPSEPGPAPTPRPASATATTKPGG
jgi:DNA-binding response OmpR family regulator